MIEKVSLSSELKNIYVFTLRLFGIRPGVLHDLILKFFFYSYFLVPGACCIQKIDNRRRPYEE